MFYIYILESKEYNKYYVGHTKNVARRINEHNNLSDNSYTAKYRPWVLKAEFVIGESRGLAMKIERHIKKQKSKKYIDDIISRGSIDLLIKRYSSVG